MCLSACVNPPVDSKFVKLKVMSRLLAGMSTEEDCKDLFGCFLRYLYSSALSSLGVGG